MNGVELLEELKNIRSNLRGLAARAVINYIMTELNEINSISEEELSNILSNALSLVEIEENDIHRIKEFIRRKMMHS